MSISFRELSTGSVEFSTSDVFCCEGGGEVSPLVLAYESYGEMNEAKDNVILVNHALSTSSHLRSHDRNLEPGWWENMVGPGACLDTNKYCVICINNLGSCYGSSGPASVNPNTGTQYRAEFPEISIVDMVRSQKLLIDALGVTHLHTIIGNSMGGMLSLAWLCLYPEHAKNLVSISSCAQSYPANNANRFLQRDMIQLDSQWQQGNYQHSRELEGFKAARRLGLLTYRNWAELNERFVNKAGKDAIEHYLGYNADKFVKRFDCNSYLTLLQAMNTFNLADKEGGLSRAFTGIQARVLVVSVDSDILFTPSQQHTLYQGLVEAGIDAGLIEHHSSYGHDAFLVETEAFGGYIRAFIDAACT
jgi:homoserine O-acetyltransferase